MSTSRMRINPKACWLKLRLLVNFPK